LILELMMKGSLLKPVISRPDLRFNPEWVDGVFSSAETVWIGFSGGVDSHVLLHLLASQISNEQRQKLAVIHVHHGLSNHADEWLEHCANVCTKFDVRFTAERVTLESQSSLEEAARNARYRVFESLLGSQDVLLLAHHSGDQAETVLFRLLRGTGGKGLAGIPQERLIGDKGACLLRPFLDVSKADLEHYAKQQQLEWIHDESNVDERFTRNFLRHSIVPVLKERFPKLESNIASSAQRIKTDYAMLDQFARRQLEDWCDDFGGLDLSVLVRKARDERLFWFRQFLQIHNVSLPHSQLESIESMFSGGEDRHPEFRLLNGRLLRHRNSIYLLPLDREVVFSPLIENTLLKRSFDSIRVRGCEGCVLRERPQGAVLTFEKGKTRKLKKWLNDQQVPSWWRDHLPYIFVEDQLVAIGTLWRHPEYSHLEIDWTLMSELPLLVALSQD
jgi:tRNA(Ile)-lysidine synthase